jgi:hypothetical protein
MVSGKGLSFSFIVLEKTGCQIKHEIHIAGIKGLGN